MGTAGTRSYLTTSISVTVLSVRHRILALSTAFSVQLQSLLGQEDMQSRHLCANENQPCPDLMDSQHLVLTLILFFIILKGNY